MLIADVLRLVRPPKDKIHSAEAWESAFADVAQKMLREVVLYIKGIAHRLVEVECYFVDEKEHDDPFTHRQPQQQKLSEWYFHALGAGYKGGTFKGLDIAFSDNLSTTFAGMLIRSIECVETGRLIEGSCRCVDYILHVTGSADIRSLVALKDFHLGCEQRDDSSLLYLKHEPIRVPVMSTHLDSANAKKPSAEATSRTPRQMEREVFSSSRVGLSLRVNNDANALDFLCRLYRFCTRPESITKGRIHTICAMRFKDNGRSADSISAVVNAKPAQVAAYLDDFERGLQGKYRASEFIGKKSLTTSELCRCLGSALRLRQPSSAALSISNDKKEIGGDELTTTPQQPQQQPQPQPQPQ